jgi:hypothetical protein
MVDLKEALRETSVPSGDWRATLRDFVIAMVIFGGLFGGVAVDSGNAFPMPPPPELSASANVVDGASAATEPVVFKVQPPTIAGGPAASSDDRYTLLIMMTLALASLAAFNTTVWRHLRRTYAEPRRK